MQTGSLGPDVYSVDTIDAGDARTAGVSWGAVFAGAAVAAALSLILLILGFGLGLSAVSPWSYNEHATALGAASIIWIAFMQLAASAIGGYLAGRLRVKWASVHADEVYFRDTAHGLLTWAVASLFTAALLAGATRAALGGAIDIGTGASATAAPAVAAAVTSSQSNSASPAGAAPFDYFSDMLLRSEQTAPQADSEASRREVNRIFLTSIGAGQLAPDDRAYLAQLVANRSGMSQVEAEQRVDAVYGRAAKAASDAKTAAKNAAETARKAAAHSALWMFVALLLGAFVASLAATVGGRQRDHVPVIAG
ncbi:MAG TPA: hypothetical protein VL051_12515 [Burkholderiaceae bacterium]|nr:hypothetical protein [Burkholderiaceae bacterium]